MKKTALIALLCLALLLGACAADNMSGADLPGKDTSDSHVISHTDATAQTNPPETSHTHEYASEIVEPTKTEQGHTVYTCSCGYNYFSDYTGISGELEVEKPEYRILFVGNSYTSRNNLAVIFTTIARSEGYTVTVDTVTKGGWTLSQMADVRDAYGAEVDAKLRGQTKYDIIFLQEQSERPASSPSLFYSGVRALAAKIEAAGAKRILYQTWGRKTGHSTLTSKGWTNKGMTILLATAYEKIAEECGMAISAVGSAFYDVYTNHPEIELYDPDLTHPSPAGSYLAALCHYAAVYGKSPVGISTKVGVASDEYRLILQQAAHKAVFGESILAE